MYFVRRYIEFTLFLLFSNQANVNVCKLVLTFLHPLMLKDVNDVKCSNWWSPEGNVFLMCYFVLEELLRKVNNIPHKMVICGIFVFVWHIGLGVCTMAS